jgi:hypothetical protein
MIVDQGVSYPDDTDLDDPTEATKREGHGPQRVKQADVHLDRGMAVGRYIIIGVLGSRMGVVYNAYDPEPDRGRDQAVAGEARRRAGVAAARGAGDGAAVNRT